MTSNYYTNNNQCSTNPSDCTTTTVTNLSASTTVTVLPTEMIYYTFEGNFEMNCTATVLNCQLVSTEGSVANKHEKKEPTKPEDNKNIDDNGNGTTRRSQKVPFILTLDRTVLYAQGGGQPTDTGTITSTNEEDKDPSIIFKVEKVLLDRNTMVAAHMGTVTTDTANTTRSGMNPDCLFPVGQVVHVQVDVDRRRLLSECHTAGHVVDSAMATCQWILPPHKAYHFIEGPYIEYKGTYPIDKEPSQLLQELQEAFQQLVREDIDTQIQLLDITTAQQICDRVQDKYFDLQQDFSQDSDDYKVRIVTVAGWPCPCGGTHVQSTGQLKARNWGITDMTCKKGIVKIKYNQNWNETRKNKTNNNQPKTKNKQTNKIKENNTTS